MDKKAKWKSILGIIVIWIAIIFNLPAGFGIFYVIWSIYDIKLGYTSIFMETVYKEENKLLFWLITLTWFLAGIAVIMSVIFGRFDINILGK